MEQRPSEPDGSTWNRAAFDAREPLGELWPYGRIAGPIMLSLARYAALLSRPALRRAIAASVLGRLPVGITGLALLLLIHASTHSFAAAGTTTSCYIVGLASVAPILGRSIDRWGPRIPLRLSTLAYPGSLTALVLLVGAGAARWQILLLAAVAGATLPPITVSLRSFLRQQLGDDPLLATAYSLESVLIESIFVVGPLLVALLVWLASPATAVLTAAASGAGGALVFLRSPAVAHWKSPPAARPSLVGALSAPGFAVLMGVVMGYSIAFGLVEIGVTAFAAEAGQRPMAGVLLGLMSVGSVLGGLAYGSRSWRAPLFRQFAVALFLMGTGITALAGLSQLWVFAAASALAGVVMAPALAIQSQLVSRTAPAHHVTEAFTWSSTSLLAGVGLGMSIGGWLLEHARAPAVLATGGIVCLLASAAALTALQRP